MEKQVLVADDDFEITQSLSIRLKQLGCSVMRSPDALHALLGAQRLRPDLLILDVNMPGGNGLAVAEMLAGDAECCKIPVIMHTGCSDELTLARCKHFGHHHVQKSPHSWTEIKAIVCKLFDIVPDHLQSNGVAADRGKLLLADADGSRPRTENQKVTPGNDPGHDDVPRASRSWAEIRALSCEALDGEAERAQPNGQPANEGKPSAGSASAPRSQSGNRNGAHEHAGNHEVPRASSTWAEIRAATCKALDSEGGQTQTDGEVADKGEPPTAGIAASESAPINGTAAPAAQSTSLNAGITGGPEPMQTVRLLRNPDQHEDPKETTNEAKRVTVLCIDDDPDISKIIKMRLVAYGVEVLRAFSGMHGFWTALDSRPDVIICDMSMPDGEGNYIIGRFKSHPLTENVPLIILTGQANPGVKRTMLSQGVSAYLTKPLAFDQLLQALRAHIDLPEKPLDASPSSLVLSAGST